ncbi:hypothetical protein GH714_031619 [Hevea brasiliensis]|uniref:VWFA domain-containing protein n=1 Tax=Hevea brasiliensis TaxID=3981 RepID=A0A6A6K1M9_HEVBR|nr:hypothetical protein GH714_043874 [Hevea brasiliensis]KAF2302039.1 hypothetical protein GH714_031619 [Hevea brasiliensis]
MINNRDRQLQVIAALAQSGLGSSNLIVGIDFTKSNEWTGARSFNRRSLHHIGSEQNPYEQAISIIGRTLSAFDEDNLIPCFGFGDESTNDQEVFSFHQDERFCNGFEEVLARYREIVPQLGLAGPTSFAPIIEMAITIVEQSSGRYHVLLIIADGQLTRSVDTQHGQLSLQEKGTVDAIVKASEYPLSIILVGVGDGPWDMMRELSDNIPARAFDNFQFVNFTEIMSKNVNASRKETEFALAALMEVPAQYKATIELGIMGRRSGNAPERVPLPHLFMDHLLSATVEHLQAQTAFIYGHLLFLDLSHQFLDMIHHYLLILDMTPNFLNMILQSTQLHIQVLLMMIRYVPFVLLIERTWPSVAAIRLVASVEKTCNRAQFVEAQYRLESSFINHLQCASLRLVSAA